MDHPLDASSSNSPHSYLALHHCALQSPFARELANLRDDVPLALEIATMDTLREHKLPVERGQLTSCGRYFGLSWQIDASDGVRPCTFSCGAITRDQRTTSPARVRALRPLRWLSTRFAPFFFTDAIGSSLDAVVTVTLISNTCLAVHQHRGRSSEMGYPYLLRELRRYRPGVACPIHDHEHLFALGRCVKREPQLALEHRPRGQPKERQSDHLRPVHTHGLAKTTR